MEIMVNKVIVYKFDGTVEESFSVNEIIVTYNSSQQVTKIVCTNSTVQVFFDDGKGQLFVGLPFIAEWE
jgi:hypothetical protein